MTVTDVAAGQATLIHVLLEIYADIPSNEALNLHSKFLHQTSLVCCQNRFTTHVIWHLATFPAAISLLTGDCRPK